MVMFQQSLRNTVHVNQKNTNLVATWDRINPDNRGWGIIGLVLTSNQASYNGCTDI